MRATRRFLARNLLVSSFLAALIAIGVLAVANAQQAPPDEPVACDAGEGAPTAAPTKPPWPAKNEFGPVTNVPDKMIDIVVISNPALNGTPDFALQNMDHILRLYPTTIPNTPVAVNSVQQAINAIINAYNANNPPRKLNVYLGGHGRPGSIKLGVDRLNNDTAAGATAEANFVSQLNGKIEHLKFLSCSTAAGQAFMDKLLIGLGAARVSGFTNKLWSFPPAGSTWYLNATTTPYKQYADTFRIELPGVKEEKTPINTFTPTRTATPTITPTPTPTPRPVGGISLDPQLPGSSGSDAWLLEGVIAGAMAVVVITGGVWYGRRRRVR